MPYAHFPFLSIYKVYIYEYMLLSFKPLTYPSFWSWILTLTPPCDILISVCFYRIGYVGTNCWERLIYNYVFHFAKKAFIGRNQHQPITDPFYKFLISVLFLYPHMYTYVFGCFRQKTVCIFTTMFFFI